MIIVKSTCAVKAEYNERAKTVKPKVTENKNREMRHVLTQISNLVSAWSMYGNPRTIVVDNLLGHKSHILDLFY